MARAIVWFESLFDAALARGASGLIFQFWSRKICVRLHGASGY